MGTIKTVGRSGQISLGKKFAGLNPFLLISSYVFEERKSIV